MMQTAQSARINKRRKMKRKRQMTAALLICTVVAIVGLVVWLCVSIFGNSKRKIDFYGKTKEEVEIILAGEAFYPGISINGIDVSRRSVEEVVEYFRSAAPNSAGVELKYVFRLEQNEYPLDATTVEIGSDLQEIVDEAHAIGRVVDQDDLADEKDEEYKNDLILSRRYKAYLELQENPKQYTITYRIDKPAVGTAVQNLLEPFVEAAENATIVGFDAANASFSYSDHQNGFFVDINGAKEQVGVLLDQGIYEQTIEVMTQVQEPELTKEKLQSTLTRISSASTSTERDDARNTNIRKACEKINGSIYQPGEIFSFNDVVGERTADRGFLQAGAISDGLAIKEYGGGICQVSSMVYIAALKADLTIVSRSSHTWPSSYLPHIGTDATVSWGGPDFRFTNSTNYPIAIIAYFNGVDVTVEIYGRPIEDGLVIKVVGKETVRNKPKPTKYEADPALAVGKREEVSGSHDEIGATSYKQYYRGDTFVKEVKITDSYYAPIQGHIKVGVLGEDGTIHKLNEETGEVIMPETTATETTVPSQTTPAAESTTTPPPQDGPDIPVDESLDA